MSAAPDFYSLVKGKTEPIQSKQPAKDPDFYSLVRKQTKEPALDKQPERFEVTPGQEKPEGFLDRFGRSLSYQAQTSQAVTPRGARIIAEEAPKLAEGATAGFYKAPEQEIPEEEKEGRRVIGESFRLTGEAGLISGANKFLKFMGINPKTWYGRAATSAGIGAGLSTAKQAAYEGEVDPAEVAKDAALWAGIDVGLEAINSGLNFKKMVEYIAEKSGNSKTDVLKFLKDRVMAKFRGKPQPAPEVLAAEALDVAKEASRSAEQGTIEITPVAEEKPVAPISKEAAKAVEAPKETEITPSLQPREEEITPSTEPKTNDELVQSKVISSSEAPEEKLSLKERLQDYETRFINQYAPLDRLAEGKETFENPGKLAELVEGAAGQAKQALELGQFDIETLETTGPGLRQIFEPKRILEVEGKKKLDRKAFRAYLAARSSLDRAKLGQKTAISPEEAKSYIEKHKRYEPLARDYTNFLNQNLSNLRKSGMLTADAEKAMREMYLNYAPLHRLIDKPKRAHPLKTKTLQPEKLPKRAKGSARTIIDPLESAIKNTAASYRAIAKNRTMNAIRNQLEPLGYKAKPAPKTDHSAAHLQDLMGDAEPDISDKLAGQLSEIKNVLDPASYAPGDGKIFGYRDGKRWEMEAPQEVIDAVKNLNPAQSSFVLGMVNKWRGIFSSGIVLQPGTMLRLSGMDLVVTTLQSKYPTFPVLDLPINVFYNFPRMLLEVLKKGELYQDYLKSGAAQFALQGLDRSQVESMVTDITNSERTQQYGLKELSKDTLKLPWTAIKSAWKTLGKVSEKLGDANRMIEFEKSYSSAIGRGLSRSQALAQAAHDAFEVSVPYGRQGSSAALQEMYKIFPFMRTIVNSNLTFAKAMDPRNPNFTKMLSTALAALTLPTLYFYMRNRNDERYQRIPQEDRDRNIYIYTSEDPDEEPIRLRKIWQYGFVFQTMPERVVEFLAQKDPKAFEKLFKNFEYEFSPFQFMSLSSAIEDGFHPEKLFEGTRFQVIPEKQRRIDASLQHTQSTSDVAKKLGALTKISPIYIDFIIGNVGGGLGQNIARLFDEVEYFTGLNEERRPESKHADNVLWGTFFARGPTKRSEYLNNFYKRHDQMQTIKSTIRQLKKEGQDEKADQYAKAHPYVETEWMRRRVGNYYKKIDDVLARPAQLRLIGRRKAGARSPLHRSVSRGEKDVDVDRNRALPSKARIYSQNKEVTNLMATQTQLMMRSSIVGPLMRPITPPDLLEQIRYLLLWKSDVQKLPSQGPCPPSNESGWRFIKDDDIPIWFQTKWAANYARYLEWLRNAGYFKEWRYQPKNFPIKGIRGGYTPDFRILRNDEAHFWIETKNIHEDLDLYEKTVYFEMNYPDETLVMADINWFEENGEMLKRHLSDWED